MPATEPLHDGGRLAPAGRRVNERESGVESPLQALIEAGAPNELAARHGPRQFGDEQGLSCHHARLDSRHPSLERRTQDGATSMEQASLGGLVDAQKVGYDRTRKPLDVP